MENVRKLPLKKEAETGFSVKNTAINLIYLVCGIFVSKGAVLGNLAPFGASFAAAVPKKRLLPSMLGASFGYIMLNPSGGFRYIAVIIAVGAARWLTSDLKLIRQSRLFAPLAASIPILATGIALLLGSSGSISSFADCVVEAALAGAAAYFISVSVELAETGRGFASFSVSDTACVVVTGCVLILALGSVQVEGVSLGRILACTAIMLCACYGGVGGGAVSGAATGAVFGIADRQLGYYCGSFAFGGLISGLFSPLGKLGCAVSFVLSNSLMSLAFSSSVSIAPVIAESVVAAAVFLILPKEFGNFVSPLFEKTSDSPLADALRRNIVMRLDFASRAISNVKKDVGKVSDKLGEMYSPDFEWVCECTAKEVCAGCGLRMYCFKHEKDVTSDDFMRLEEPLRRQGAIDEKDVESEFVKACCKKGEIAASMTKNYREFCCAVEARKRVSELRSVVAGQFAGVSDILMDLSKEFAAAQRCDAECSERVIQCLNSLEALPIECVCLINAEGRMNVEMTLSDKSRYMPSKSELARLISSCCGRRFDMPVLVREGSRVRASLCETPIYDVEIGSDQHIAGGGKICGDCIDYFNDGAGKIFALVCDGMGTGGRAAVDGNMAVSVMGRLIRSGLSPDSSLQIVNSALMVKSDDESLSTVDLAAVDLYSGAAELKKAGAPATFIKKGGRIVRLEKPSLPAGILNGIKFSTESVKLSSGDMIVMVSDGVLSGDDKWLEKLIKSWNRGSTQELASVVVSEALKRSASREDDITALVIRLTDYGTD